jgi:hypothetical protein
MAIDKGQDRKRPNGSIPCHGNAASSAAPHQSANLEHEGTGKAQEGATGPAPLQENPKPEMDIHEAGTKRNRLPVRHERSATTGVECPAPAPTCDDCDSQEGRHYCLLHGKPMTNMDITCCAEFEEKGQDRMLEGVLSGLSDHGQREGESVTLETTPRPETA